MTIKVKKKENITFKERNFVLAVYFYTDVLWSQNTASLIINYTIINYTVDRGRKKKKI